MENIITPVAITVALLLSTPQLPANTETNNITRDFVKRSSKKKASRLKVGEVIYGVATWYGKNHHGRKTSSGEKFDMHSFTAAHKTLPLNTMVLVTNLSNKKSILVRINDRGPYVKNRILDLSKASAQAIGLVNQGYGKVSIKIIGYDGTINPI